MNIKSRHSALSHGSYPPSGHHRHPGNHGIPPPQAERCNQQHSPRDHKDRYIKDHRRDRSNHGHYNPHYRRDGPSIHGYPKDREQNDKRERDPRDPRLNFQHHHHPMRGGSSQHWSPSHAGHIGGHHLPVPGHGQPPVGAYSSHQGHVDIIEDI